MLDAETKRTGRSMSSLIRHAIATTYGHGAGDVVADLRTIASAAGAWTEREIDGAAYVEDLRSGRRLNEFSE